MYQHGSEYTCQSPNASKEQRKMAAHLPTVLMLLLRRKKCFPTLTKLPEAASSPPQKWLEGDE